jgi:hypothetical protein
MSRHPLVTGLANLLRPNPLCGTADLGCALFAAEGKLFYIRRALRKESDENRMHVQTRNILSAKVVGCKTALRAISATRLANQKEREHNRRDENRNHH